MFSMYRRKIQGRFEPLNGCDNGFRQCEEVGMILFVLITLHLCSKGFYTERLCEIFPIIVTGNILYRLHIF